MLSRELNLRETTSATLDALVHTFGHDDWFTAFKNMKVGFGNRERRGQEGTRSRQRGLLGERCRRQCHGRRGLAQQDEPGLQPAVCARTR